MTATPDLMVAVCSCGADLLVHRETPEGLEDIPRVFLCIDCAKSRLSQTADGNVRVIRRPRVAKAGWRITDDLEHEVVITNTESQEDDSMKIDINKVTDAELGADVRAALLSNAEVTVERERKKAKAKDEKKGKKGHAERKAEIARIQAIETPPFVVGDLEVPSLEMDEVTSLDVAVPAGVRSTYNKAMHRLEATKGRLLPKDATYAQAIEVHLELVTLAAEAAKAKPKKKAKAKKEAVAVEFDLKTAAKEHKARRKALIAEVMEARGVDKAEAKRLLAGVGA